MEMDSIIKSLICEFVPGHKILRTAENIQIIKVSTKVFRGKNNDVNGKPMSKQTEKESLLDISILQKKQLLPITLKHRNYMENLVDLTNYKLNSQPERVGKGCRYMGVSVICPEEGDGRPASSLRGVAEEYTVVTITGELPNPQAQFGRWRAYPCRK